MTRHRSSTQPAGGFAEKAGTVLPVADGTALSIDAELCLNLRGRSLSCEACADHCPSAAITLSVDSVALDTGNCTACGACLPACPSGVFRLDTFSPSHFLRELKGSREIHIHCTGSTGGDDGIHIPCLHLLDARLVAAAFAEGTEVFQLAGLGHCEHCGKGNAINQMMAVQNRLQQWFGIDAMPRLVVESIPLAKWIKDHRRRKEQAQMSRRQFFRQAGRHAVSVVSDYSSLARGDTDTPPDPETFQPASPRQQRAAEYQSLLAAHVGELPWRPDGIPWHLRAIDDDACNACLVCGQRCPTGALRAEQDPAGRGIRLAASLCTDCGLCDRLCPMGAIERHRARDAAEVTAGRSLLMYRRSRTCPRCGRDFLPQNADEAPCPACSNEQALEDEWLAQCAR